MKVGKKECYDVNTIDKKTKFIVEEEFMTARTKVRIHAYFKRIKNSIYDLVLTVYNREKLKEKKKRKLVAFVSDGFQNYKTAAMKYFHRVCSIQSGVPIACRKYGLKHNNNAIERYNENINERYKIIRHWKNFESAKDTLKLRHIIYNFVRPHMELNGRTPAEAAGIEIGGQGNKLLRLIEIAYMPKI